jgi:ATP-dependent HslUV protease ATP-binding subunit HslU
VELHPLGKEDFVRILREPENALTIQYEALMATEGIELVYEQDAIEEVAQIAHDVNSRTENIGARRLHTVMERLLDEVSFNAHQLKGQQIAVTRQYVQDKLHDIVKDEDLSRYIL